MKVFGLVLAVVLSAILILGSCFCCIQYVMNSGSSAVEEPPAPEPITEEEEPEPEEVEPEPEPEPEVVPEIEPTTDTIDRKITLLDLFDLIDAQLEMEVVIDHPTLKERGIDPYTKKIGMLSRYQGLPASLLTELLTAEFKLDWDIVDGQLFITTSKNLESMLSTQTYDISEFLFAPPGGRAFSNAGAYKDIILDVVAPETWTDWGGPGTIELQNIRGRAVFTVEQSRPVHEELKVLLTELRRLNLPQADRPAPSWATEDAYLFEQFEKTIDNIVSAYSFDKFAEKVNGVIEPQFFLNRMSLREMGASPEFKAVNINGREMSVGDALDAVAAEHNLAYSWNGEVLWMTTYEHSCDSHINRIYDVSSILRNRQGGSLLINSLKENVEPKSWDVNGGPGYAFGIELKHGSFLVIRQPWRVHRQVAQYMNELEAR
jgi:hypothetical protein